MLSTFTALPGFLLLHNKSSQHVVQLAAPWRRSWRCCGRGGAARRWPLAYHRHVRVVARSRGLVTSCSLPSPRPHLLPLTVPELSSFSLWRIPHTLTSDAHSVLSKLFSIRYHATPSPTSSPSPPLAEIRSPLPRTFCRSSLPYFGIPPLQLCRFSTSYFRLPATSVPKCGHSECPLDFESYHLMSLTEPDHQSTTFNVTPALSFHFSSPPSSSTLRHSVSWQKPAQKGGQLSRFSLRSSSGRIAFVTSGIPFFSNCHHFVSITGAVLSRDVYSQYAQQSSYNVTSVVSSTCGD